MQVVFDIETMGPELHVIKQQPAILVYLLLCSFALDKAYDLLASKADDDQEAGICFADFLMFMYYYQPYTRMCTESVQE